MIQYFIAVFKDEQIMFKINREEEDSQFFFLNDKVLNLNELDITEKFKKNFPSENELRFELLFRNKLNDSYESNEIKFINIGEDDHLGYKLIKEIIKEKITYGVPFDENEKISIAPMIIHINGFLFRNIKKISLGADVLEISSNDGILNDFISTEDVESFEVDDEDIKVEYVGNNDIHHYDLFVSRRINELLNTFDSDTDKPLLDADKAVQWFKDVGYELSILKEDDDLDYQYSSIFRVPCYDDDSCTNKLERLYKLNDEVLNLLKHF